MNKTVNSNNFDNEQATLRDIKLEFNEKGLVIIQVPSESEKTSLLIKLTQNNKFMDEAYGNMHNIIYLSQDIELIDSMSIFDNLIITLNDNSKIELLLKKYNLYNLRHIKINKCTLLQKKQIQFIKSLLLNPNILLCDEPLSSLDYENAMDLMEVIQDSSKFFLVIAVMKDSTLANKYADRIIEINKDAITSDVLINKCSNLEFTNNLPQKKFFDTLLAVKRHLFSKPFRFLLNLSLIMLISLFAYLQFNILSSMNSNVDNLILSSGNQLENRIKGEDASLYTKYYRKFDLLFFKDIQETLINNPEIMAYAPYYSSQYSEKVNDKLMSSLPNNDIYKKFIILENESEIINEISLGNRPLDGPIVVYDDIKNWTVRDLNDNLITNKVVAFNLINNNQKLPLIIGTYPKNSTDIIIDKDIAEHLLQTKNLQNYDELLNENIELGVKSLQNVYSMYVDDIPIIDIHTFTICGVTSIQNSFTNMVFMTDDIKNNFLYNTYIDNFDDVFFQFNHLLIDPSFNAQKIANKINDQGDYVNTSYSVYQGIDSNGNVINYKTPKDILVYNIIFTVLCLLILIILNFSQRKQLLKENKNIVYLKYSKSIYQFMQILIYLFLSVSICLILFPSLVERINEFATKNNYIKFMTFNPCIIGLVCLISSLIYGLIYYLLTKTKGKA